MSSSNTIFASMLFFYTALFFLIGLGATPDIFANEVATSYDDSTYYLVGGNYTYLCTFHDHDWLWFGDGYYDCADESTFDFDEVVVQADGFGLTVMSKESSPAVAILSFLNKIPIVKYIVPLLGGILYTFSGEIPSIITTLIFVPLGIIALWIFIRAMIRGDGS